MKRPRTVSPRGIARRLADAVTHNFALKVLSLLLALVIYYGLKRDAVNSTPAVEKVVKAVVEGARIDNAAATNSTDTATRPVAADTSGTETDVKD